jgi:hypothetical protein
MVNDLSMRDRKLRPNRTQGDGIGKEIVSDRAPHLARRIESLPGKCNDRSGSQNDGELLLALHWARLTDPPLHGH